MSNSDLKPLSELMFNADGPLHDLAVQAARRTDLTGYLRAGLPTELQDHLRAGNARPDGTLVVMADSPAWAARLRFEGALLLARCREVHPEIQRIKVRVLADQDP
jgi:hypothetical protein